MHCIQKVFYSIILIFSIYACSSNPLDVNASNVKVDLEYINIDSSLRNSNNQNKIKFHNKFKIDFPYLYRRAYGQFIGIDFNSDEQFLSSINQYYSDPYISRLQKRIAQLGNLKNEKEKIHQSFQYLKYHFPKMQLPKKIAFISSTFAHRTPVTKDNIGISLECYLDNKSKVIKELPVKDFPQYYIEELNQKYMVRDVIQEWVSKKILLHNDHLQFAEKMIYWGKVLYLINASIPDADLSLICRYSPNDFKWAEDKESDIWKHIIDQKMLYKRNDLTDKGWFSEAPFTSGLPNESPQRLGQYIGYKMVLSYMAVNPNIALKELIKVSYTDIMQEYKIEK
ncbi:MAG: hypothetical protein CL824_03090 [Crocinitomicaceae bacterium]|nr:hypothetical protein [Crocinitomicaceae bacterium]